MATTSREIARPSGAGRGGPRGGRSQTVAAVWGLAIGLFLVYGGLCLPIRWLLTDGNRNPYVSKEYGQSLLWLILVHFASVAVIVAVLLMVAGVLGSGLGLPGLFRDPPAGHAGLERERRKDPSYLASRGSWTAFWGAFGATIVIATVWTSIYFTEMVEHYSLFRSEHFTQNCVHGLLDPPGNDFPGHGALHYFLLYAAAPFVGLLVLAELLPAASPGVEREGRERAWEFLHALVGIASAIVAVVFLARVGALTHPLVLRYMERLYDGVGDVRLPSPRVGNVVLHLEAFPLYGINERLQVRPDPGIIVPLLTAHAQFTALAALAIVLLAALAALFPRMLSPGLGLCMLLSGAVVFLASLAWSSTPVQAVLIVGLLGLIIWTNGDPYKYRFPGMPAGPRGGIAGPPNGDPDKHPSPGAPSYYDYEWRIRVAELPKILAAPPPAMLLDNEAVLKAWCEQTRQAQPKLVVIATTGGAYRAAFWTTVVLEELQRQMPGFHRHVRLFTGASGGMVGAGYVAASMTESGPPAEGYTERLRNETVLDSLSPVVRRLLLGDLPSTLWPGVHARDRGIELERQWWTMDTTFRGLSEGERAGWRPSLILSPMVVESGRRLLISNLRLDRLSETRPMLSARPEAGGPGPAGSAPIFSRPAIEFFRLFPGAWPAFSLQTAVRMSATFPLASPAVSLPVEPPRRVVDAGYYDNYGVDLATSWIYQHYDWLRDNTSGVALVQVRAYPSEQAVLSYFGEALDLPPGRITRLRRRAVTSFQGLTTPAAGGFSAREWSMRFRNATQIRLLYDHLNGPEEPRFFETFVFENFTDFAMNWFLSDHDIEDMRKSIGAYDEATGDGAGDGKAPARRGTRRSSSDLAAAARVPCRDANRDQKKRLMDWFDPGRGARAAAARAGAGGGPGPVPDRSPGRRDRPGP